MKNNTKQIVLIGGGYASIWAYRSIINELLIEMMAGKIRVKVICPDEFHFFHGWTAESLMGIIGDQNRMSPLAEIFEHAEIIKGKVIQIDTASRIVKVDMSNGPKCTVRYDHILLGLGSFDSSSIEGIAEYAFQLKSYSQYLATKTRIQDRMRQAANADCILAQKLLRFVIAGCGYTGVEIATNLAEYIQVLKKQYPSLRNAHPTIYLINSKDEILPGLNKGLSRMRKYTEKILLRYGIETMNNLRITRITEDGAHLNDGSFVESEFIISTIGQSRIVIDGTEKMGRDSEKRILTNSYLQVNNQCRVWGAGDAVNVTHFGTMKPCPSNALWAIKQGEHAGKNIARAILKQPIKPFTYKGLGQCASLGIGKGIGELYGMQFTGWLAWITRWFFFQYFMPSKKVMWREITDWVYLFITGKRKYLSITEEIRKVSLKEQVLPGNLNQLAFRN
jgi:NADH:ubiquinone reductase (H+-translocating)